MPSLDPDELVPPTRVALTEDELGFITAGLSQWGGPAKPQAESARLVGFDNVRDMRAATRRLGQSIRRGHPLSRRDWQRIAVLAELIFASDRFGAGVEWETVTGRNEVTDLRLLRQLQRKLAAL